MTTPRGAKPRARSTRSRLARESAGDSGSKGRSSVSSAPGRSRPLTRYDLYESCVQHPSTLVSLLVAIHGGKPERLGEDFCGSAALSRAWVSMIPRGRAIATDIDPEPLAEARKRLGRGSARARVTLVQRDVLAARGPATRAARQACDVVFVGNFSIGEIHERPALVAYLRAARARLASGRSPGVFVCDTYGGSGAFRTGGVQRMHPLAGDDAARVRYTWQQRRADPLTGMVENALHFRVERAGEKVQEFTDAFVYRWRLWSLCELRDAMSEAGFSRVDVFAQVPDATDDSGNAYVLPITDPNELGDDWIVCVGARV